MGLIYIPPVQETCKCPDKPGVRQYPVGTIWECDVCVQWWKLTYVVQYNEGWYAWHKTEKKK